MPTSRTAVQYLVPYFCDCKSIKTQTNNIGLTWTRSGIESRSCLWRCRCWCTIRRYSKSGKPGSGRLVVTLPWFTLLAVLLQCFMSFINLQSFRVFEFFFSSSIWRKQIGPVSLDCDVDRFLVKPTFVQKRCVHLSRVDALCWFEFVYLRM